MLPAAAQVLTVKDKISHAPIEFATVYSVSGQQHVITDQKGRADIAAFGKTDTIIIRSLGYATITIFYEEMEASQFKIYLNPSSISLDEAVISVVRWKEEKRDVPSKITTIPRRDALLQNPQTAADLLATSGEVFIQKSQLGGGSPMIRGFSSNRVLLTVDGVRMNNAIFRSGNIQNVISLDPLAVERTEVLFGPGAVMYGSDAIGGAMNFYTLTPQFSSTGKSFVKGNSLLRHSTAGNEKTGHFDINIGLKKWAFVSSISYSDFGNLKMGSRGPDEFLRTQNQTRIDGRDTVLINPDSKVQKPTAYRQLNLMQKLRFAPNENWDLQYGFHYSTTSDVPRYDRLIQGDGQGGLQSAEWHYGPQDWMMNVLNITHTAKNKLFNRMRLTLAHQYFGESRHTRGFRHNRMNHRTEKVHAYSINLDFDKPLTEKQSLLYGTETVVNRIGSFAQSRNIITQDISPISTRYPNGSKWNSMAVYGNYINRLSKKWTLQTGLRYNYITANAEVDTSFHPLPVSQLQVNTGALTGSGGIAYKPTKLWQLNVNLSTGFRAPNIDDLGKVFDSEPGHVVVPNPGLGSEYAYNGEVGVSRLVSDFLKIEMTGFYTILENAMVRRNFSINGQDSMMYDGEMSKIIAIQNAANAYVYGMQSGVEIKFPRGFGLTSRFTYQRGEEELAEGGKAALRHAVPWFGLTRVTYSRNRLKADFYVMYQSAVSYGQMTPSERAKPHLYATNRDGSPYSPQWFTINVKAMYQITDYLMINAGMENLADLRYRPYSSGITAPGRNFILSLKGSF